MVACRPPVRLSGEPALVAARPLPLKARQAIRLQIMQDMVGAHLTLSAALTPHECVALDTEVAFWTGMRIAYTAREALDRRYSQTGQGCKNQLDEHQLLHRHSMQPHIHIACVGWQFVCTLSEMWRLCMDRCCPIWLSYDENVNSTMPSPRCSALLSKCTGPWRLLRQSTKSHSLPSACPWCDPYRRSVSSSLWKAQSTCYTRWRRL